MSWKRPSEELPETDVPVFAYMYWDNDKNRDGVITTGERKYYYGIAFRRHSGEWDEADAGSANVIYWHEIPALPLL